MRRSGGRFDPRHKLALGLRARGPHPRHATHRRRAPTRRGVLGRGLGRSFARGRGPPRRQLRLLSRGPVVMGLVASLAASLIAPAPSVVLVGRGLQSPARLLPVAAAPQPHAQDAGVGAGPAAVGGRERDRAGEGRQAALAAHQQELAAGLGAALRMIVQIGASQAEEEIAWWVGGSW